jgi:Acetyltransferase (GNAT) domain
MTWRFQPAAQSFAALGTTWDAINKSRGNHILLDSGFVAPLLRNFDNGKTILGVEEDSSVAGAALLVRKNVGIWETFQPSQAPIGMFILGNPRAGADQIRKLTRSLPGYAMQFSVLQQDPDYAPMEGEQDSAGLERLDYISTARISLSETFEDYWKKRAGKFKYNLSRRRRRLEENRLQGELVIRRKPEEVASAIHEYGRLESSSWKASGGTAVVEDSAQGKFYREVFEHFCERGEGLIFQFLINGRVAASDLCLERDGMHILLKTSYDEEFAEFSPSLLMREDIVRFLFAEKQARIVEFYGRVMEWHTRWTDDARILYHINCYRSSLTKSLKKFVGRFV